MEEVRAAFDTPLAYQTKSGAGRVDAAQTRRLELWWTSVNSDVEFGYKLPSDQWVREAAASDGIALGEEIPRSGEWVGEIAGDADPRTTLAQPHGVDLGRSTEDILSLAERVQAFNSQNVSKVVDVNGEPMVVYHRSLPRLGCAAASEWLGDDGKKTLREALKHPDPKHKFYDTAALEIDNDPVASGLRGAGQSQNPLPIGTESSEGNVTTLSQAVNASTSAATYCRPTPSL